MCTSFQHIRKAVLPAQKEENADERYSVRLRSLPAIEYPGDRISGIQDNLPFHIGSCFPVEDIGQVGA